MRFRDRLYWVIPTGLTGLGIVGGLMLQLLSPWENSNPLTMKAEVQEAVRDLQERFMVAKMDLERHEPPKDLPPGEAMALEAAAMMGVQKPFKWSGIKNEKPATGCTVSYVQSGLVPEVYQSVAPVSIPATVFMSSQASQGGMGTWNVSIGGI